MNNNLGNIDTGMENKLFGGNTNTNDTDIMMNTGEMAAGTYSVVNGR